MVPGGPTGAVAQTSRTLIEGRVTDVADSRPLAGATVSIEGEPGGRVTDGEGRFQLQLVAGGRYTVRAVRIGYAPTRVTLDVPANTTVQINLVMARRALNLPNLVVTADPGGRARGELGTSSVIESEAIRNQTAASLAGVLELVPGVVLSPPGLDGVQQFALRAVPISGGGTAGSATAAGTTATSLASFGTQVVLDGVPLTNNTNLQSLGVRGELGFASSAGGGVDLRRIPATTLERVEVIRGIPSARFGDLTQGVVLVETRAGRVAPELRVRFDARTVELTAIGGAGLGRHQIGTASFNAARTRLAPGARDEVGSRLSGQIAHRVDGRRLVVDTRLEGFQVLEDEPESPVFPDTRSRSRDNGVRLSSRARLGLGSTSRVEWTSAFELNRQRSYTQAPRIRGAMPFTNRLTEGTQDGKFIGGVYVARVNVEGDPRQVYSRLELTAPARWGGAVHQLRLGAEVRREWNAGPGVQFDIEFPPQVEFNGVQGYDRPRRFDSIPAVAMTAFYLDERVSGQVGRVGVDLQAGARIDLLHQGSWLGGVRDGTFGPRFQLEVTPARQLRIRAGVGRLVKVPSVADLSPARQFYDLVNFNYYANDPAERRAILTTRIIDRGNPDLAMMRADKAEVGAEVAWGRGGLFAVTAYADRIRNATTVASVPTFLIRDRYAVDSQTIGTGGPPDVLLPPAGSDTVPVLVDRPSNRARLVSRGLEISAVIPEMRSIRTRIEVQAAWTASTLHEDGIQLSNRFGDFQLDQRIGRAPYWNSLTRKGDRTLVTARIVHHQPQAGLVVTGTVQLTVRETRRDIGGTDSLSFAGYVTRAGMLVPVAAGDRGRPEFADLRVPRNGLIDPQRGPRDWLFSLQVSKSLPRDGRLSFYAFNAFDRIGNYGSPHVVPRFFAPIRFGLELTMPVLAPR